MPRCRGGVLYKGVSWGLAHNLLSYDPEAPVDGVEWGAWELKYPDEYPSAQAWQPLKDLIDFCSAATPTEGFLQDYQNWFYRENQVDYLLLNMALNIGDNAYKNTFISTVNLATGHRWLITPWDMDSSLGGLHNGAYNDVLSNIHRYDLIAPYNRLAKEGLDGFLDEAAARWAVLSRTVFSISHVEQTLRGYAARFTRSGAWERERSRWDGSSVPLQERLGDEVDYVVGWYQRSYNRMCEIFNVPSPVELPEQVAPSTGPRKGLYTLSGQRVDTAAVRFLPKGIYVKDGRKVQVR